MEKQEYEQTELKTQTATAEEVKGEDSDLVSLGKFKDVSALLSAYNSLQSEFTKRCQRIKELESELKTADNEKKSSPAENFNKPKEEISLTESDKEQVLKEYLLNILGKKQKAVLIDGVGLGVKMPVQKPKTITQAGMLAKDIIEK